MKHRLLLILGLLAVLIPGLLWTQGFYDADFDGDGEVEFEDFVLFAKQFGLRQEEENYNPKYDLDGDDAIDFRDFLIFASFYGQKRPVLSDAIKAVLIRAKIQIKAEKIAFLPDGESLLPDVEFNRYIEQLDTQEARDTLSVVAGPDGRLSLGEAKDFLGDPHFEGTVTGTLDRAKIRMKLRRTSSLQGAAFDSLLTGLSPEDRDTLRAIADNDTLSLDEVKRALGDPILGDALRDSLRGAQYRIRAGGDAPVPVAPFLTGLSPEERDALKMLADNDTLSLGETKVGLGDPIFSDVLIGVLKRALIRMKMEGVFSLGIDRFPGELDSEFDRSALREIAGEDERLSRDEVRLALGGPIGSDATTKVLKALQLQIKADGDEPAPVDAFLMDLSAEEQDTLMALAGEDGRVSLSETKVGLGDPIFSAALTGMLKKARMTMVLRDVSSLEAASLLDSLEAETDRAGLREIAGEDERLSLDEVRLALGDPIVSPELKGMLEAVQSRIKAGGGAPVSVDALVADLPDSTREALEALAGADGLLSLDEVTVGLGDPVLGDAVEDALKQAGIRMKRDGKTSLPVDSLLVGLSDEDQGALGVIAEDDSLSLAEVKRALGDPVLSEELSDVLEKAGLRMSLQGVSSLPVDALLDSLSSDEDRDTLKAFSRKGVDDDSLSLDEMKLALGEPVVSDALEGALEEAQSAIKAGGGDPVPVAPFLDALSSDDDRAVLTAIAGDDSLSLEEAKLGLGDPILPRAVTEALEKARVQIKAGGKPSTPVDALLAGLPAEDQATLKAIAGADGELSIEEVKRALGDPVLGEDAQKALKEAQSAIKAGGGDPVPVDALTAGLSEEDQTALEALAGADGLLSLRETKVGLGDPVLSDEVTEALERAKIKMKLSGKPSVRVDDDLMEGLSPEDREALQAIADGDELSLDEAKAALGDPDPSEKAQKALKDAQSAIRAGGGAPVPVDAFAAGLSDSLDRKALKALAGADGLLSLDETKVGLGDPILSDAVEDALKQARIQMKQEGASSLPVAALMAGLSDSLDQAALKAIAGDDGSLSLNETKAVLGDPVLSETLTEALDGIKLQMKQKGVSSLSAESLDSLLADLSPFSELSPGQKDTLRAFAGGDSLSLDEVKLALGDPVVSDKVQEALDQIELQMKTGGGAPVSVQPFIDGLDSEADRGALRALAGADGEISSAELAVVQGDPVLSDAVADALDKLKMQMKAGGGAPVSVEPFVDGLDSEADRAALSALAGADGEISSAELAAALGDPVLSDAVSDALDQIKAQMKTNNGMPVPVDDLLRALPDGATSADSSAVRALAGPDSMLSSDEAKTAVGDPVLSDAVTGVLDKIQARLSAAGDTASVSVGDFIDDLTSQADRDALLALAGEDSVLSSAELAAAKGDPILSSEVIRELKRIKTYLDSTGARDIKLRGYSLSEKLTSKDSTALWAIAGDDERISLFEAKAALGEPVVFTLSGQVTDSDGAGVLGVVVTLKGGLMTFIVKGDSSFTLATDADGNYRFEGFPDGSYLLTPSAWKSLFSPPSQGVRIEGKDVEAEPFKKRPALPDSFAISGRVAEMRSGKAIIGVTVTLTGGSVDNTAKTGDSGSYRFSGLPDDSTYTVTPSALGFRFSPGNQVVTLAGEDVDLKPFQGTPLELTPTDETITIDLNGVKMEMVWIEAGTFEMGTPDDEANRFDREGPQHEVSISGGFYLGKYEVTQEQWKSVMGTTPWKGQPFVNEQDRRSPAVYVSWKEANAFIGKLNAKTGDSPYRLPTEAEWEYACRAGTPYGWSFGPSDRLLTDYAWYDANAWNVGRRYALRVGGKLPNPWGLYDMHGNVYEWVQDWSGPYTVETDEGGAGPLVDPEGPDKSLAQPPARVIRGGSFTSAARLTRSGFRSGLRPEKGTYTVGFRLLMANPDTSGGAAQLGTGPEGRLRKISGRVTKVHYFLPGGVFVFDKNFIVLPLGFLFDRTPVHRESVHAYRSRGIPVLTERKGIGGVKITATRLGVPAATVRSGGDGRYTISRLPEDLYEITPSRGGYSFTPLKRTVSLYGGNKSGRNFEGREAGSISGGIRPALADVWVHLKGERVDKVRTGRDGRYRFSDLPKGTYTVTPVLEGYSFSPHVRTIRLGDAQKGSHFDVKDKTGENFGAFADTIRADAEGIVVILPGGMPMEMIWIEPGTFKMGASDEDPNRYDQEQPQREVEIVKGFYLGKYEVTQEQWTTVIEATQERGLEPKPWMGQPFVYADSLNHPAVYISWRDARRFTDRLTAPVKDSILYRLPTEAEWEFACRAGSEEGWSHGSGERDLKDFAWYEFNAWKQGRKRAQSVGALLPNPWGLYDMHGNVYEWMEDWFGPYTDESDGGGGGPGPLANPVMSDARKAFSPLTRVIRGGSFASIARITRSAFRTGLPPDSTSVYVGFRVVREVLKPIPRFKPALER